MSNEQDRQIDDEVVGDAHAYRGPRLVPFLVTGALIGVIIAGLLHFFGPEPPSGGTTQELILVSVLFGSLGGLAGGVVFLLAERFTRR